MLFEIKRLKCLPRPRFDFEINKGAGVIILFMLLNCSEVQYCSELGPRCFWFDSTNKSSSTPSHVPPFMIDDIDGWYSNDI